MVANTADLRSLLLETIEDVRKKKCDPRVASAIGALAGKVIQSAKLDLDAARAGERLSKARRDEPLRLIGPKGKVKTGYGRPVARHLDDGRTLEVTRCVTDGTPNACSALYGAAWRVARAMGYHRLITYVLASESGGSLKASGWKELYKTPGRSWSVPSRRREDKHPLGQKTLWEVSDGTPTAGAGRTSTDTTANAESARAASSSD